MTLETFGWNSFFSHHFTKLKKKGFLAGRVALEHKNKHRLYTEKGEIWADVTGRLLHKASGRHDLPVAGDWVYFQYHEQEHKAVIHGILERKSKFSRKVKGDVSAEHIIAANVDTIFLVTGLDTDFNLRRIERYLILIKESGANAVIILNKTDLCQGVNEKVTDVQSIAHETPIIAMSASNKEGLDLLSPFLLKSETIALLGSSGVGKSTIINGLLGEERQDVRDVNVVTQRGRHTTTRRELFLLPSGALVMDTPGIRELQLWVGENGFTNAFQDIESLAKNCFYRNCQHVNEPDCAVKKAIENNTLHHERFENYVKMKKELKGAIERKNLKKTDTKERWQKKTKKQNKYTKKSHLDS